MKCEKTVKQLLNSSQSRLQHLIKTSQQLSNYIVLLPKVLPLEFADHCRVASYQRGQLLIHVDNATWATQLRYRVPDLLSALRSDHHCFGLTNIKVQVNPAFHKTEHPEPKKPVPKPGIMSASTAQYIKETAEHVNDSNLQKALLKLATHQKKSS